jgi:hypothetical protein
LGQQNPAEQPLTRRLYCQINILSLRSSPFVFLRINGWRLQRRPMDIHLEMMQMFDSGTFDLAHIDPWLRRFAEEQI